MALLLRWVVRCRVLCVEGVVFGWTRRLKSVGLRVGARVVVAWRRRVIRGIVDVGCLGMYLMYVLVYQNWKSMYQVAVVAL